MAYNVAVAAVDDDYNEAVVDALVHPLFEFVVN